MATVKVHEDCPFTHDEIAMFKAMLYNMSTHKNCGTATHWSWVKGYQDYMLKSKTRKPRKK